MNTTRTRKRLGVHYSEGARRLWAHLESVHMTAARFATRLGRSRSCLFRWLYGERRISLDAALAIERLTGIPASTWNSAPYRRRAA